MDHRPSGPAGRACSQNLWLSHGTSPLTRSDVYASIWSQEINLGRSLGRGHLRRLFADFARVKDEFERIGILVLLHQLQIHEPLGIGHCRAVIEQIAFLKEGRTEIRHDEIATNM